MEKPERAPTHSQDSNPANDQLSETIFTRRAKEKEENRRKLTVSTDKHSPSGTSTSPRSPLTLKLKRSIHHPYKHVSTPKPKEHRDSSSRENRYSRSSSQKRYEKRDKRHPSTSSRREKVQTSPDKVDLHRTPSNDGEKTVKTHLQSFKGKNRENPHFTPHRWKTQEEIP